MDEIKLGEEYELDAPSGATKLLIKHEWGKTEEVLGSGDYTWTPDSIGVHKISWFNTNTLLESSFLEVYVPVIDYDSFIGDYPQFSSITEPEFDVAEKIIRRVIQNYSGHKFGPYVGQTIEVQGDGGDSLVLPAPALALTSVQNSFGAELTEFVGIGVGYNEVISKRPGFYSGYTDTKADISFRLRDLFDEQQVFIIEGDFGWEFVPNEVSLAAGLILADGMGSDDVATMVGQGIIEAQIGDFRLKLNADRWGSTGNARADNLLSAYSTLGIGLV